MAKKLDKSAMQRQMSERPTESPGNSILREQRATILSEEFAKHEESSPIVVSCGDRGLSLKFVEELTNCLGHLIKLTAAVSGMHRAIEIAQRYKDGGVNWFDDDLEGALAGTELVSNLAAEYAKLVPHG